MKRYTLSRAIGLWARAKETQQADPNSLKFLKAALKGYVLPAIDADARQLKTKEFASYCETVDAYELKDALFTFDDLVAKAPIAEGTRRNYRSALSRFMKWMKGQPWWYDLFSVPVVQKNALPVRGHRTQRPKFIESKEIYGLPEKDVPESLGFEIRQLEVFRVSGGKAELVLNEDGEEKEQRTRFQNNNSRIVKPRIQPLKPSQWKREKERILLFMGWCIKEKGYKLEDITLLLMIDIELMKDYAFWSVNIRGNTHAMARTIASIAIGVAKWLNYSKVQRKNWSDIDEVLNLQDLLADFCHEYKKEQIKSQEKKWPYKEMTHEEARLIANHLRNYCAPYGAKYATSTGYEHAHERSKAVVWRHWQIYVLYKFLVYCPVRQEEVRGLKLGETFFRKLDDKGNPYYMVVTEKHKNFTKTGKKRKYRIPDILTKDLDYWINECIPAARAAVENMDNWLDFWGLSLKKYERLKERLKKAKEEGILGPKTKSSPEKYITNLEKVISGYETRINGLEVAKNNIESLGYVFCESGKTYPGSFGKPFETNTFASLIIEASMKASMDLFGPERVLRTNPHALRHIAERHIREIKGDKRAFGSYIGHSEKMGDEYANQLMSEYDITEKMAFGWWLPEE